MEEDGGARVLPLDLQVKHPAGARRTCGGALRAGARLGQRPRAAGRAPGAAGRGSGDEAARPAHWVPPSQPPGPAAAGPLGLGWGGGGGPRRGPRPPGSTNFSASSSSILLLFFSLKERENKRRVSITLRIGRRERMGGEGTGRGVGGPRVEAATAHRHALSQPSPVRRACRARVLTAPRHPPYCSPPLPRCPHGGRDQA